jgi:cobalt-zinc-cadmium efflux system outer membrane protein
LLSRAAQTPAAAEAAARLEAAQARARQAAVRSNPSLSVDVENALGGGPYDGFDQAETTVSVSQDLDLWGHRRALAGAARAQAEAAGAERDQARVEVAARIARAYAQAEAAQRRAGLAEEALTLTLADARAALTMVEEGREPTLRAIQAQSEAGGARARLDEARAEREATYAVLTATAALQAPVTLIADGVLDRDVTPAGTPSASTLAVRVAQADQAVAQSRIEAERAARRPSPTASLGLRRFQGDDASAMTFGFSVALPLFDKNRGNIEAAEADLRAAGARLDGARLEEAAGLAAATARARASVSRVSAADAAAEAAEEAYRLSRLGTDAGRISQLELRVTRAALITAKTAAVDARLARALARIELARLQGRAPFGEVQ